MLDKEKIAQLRRGYADKSLDEKDVNPDPFMQLTEWLNEAVESEIIEPNAMALSTSTKEGAPSSRIVLLKDIVDGTIVFYTNYESKKSKELIENPQASLLFFWRELGRQIRITGIVEKTSVKESGDYFKTRPYESQIGALASKQSTVIPDRKYLEEKFEKLKKKFPEGEVPLPEFWGGFRLIPDEFEFWQGRESRLHDRIHYRKPKGKWITERLSP